MERSWHSNAVKMIIDILPSLKILTKLWYRNIQYSLFFQIQMAEDSDHVEMDDIESEDDYDGYYNSDGDCDIEVDYSPKDDPEYFEYECLNIEEIERLLNENVEALSASIKVKPALAKALLHRNKWHVNDIVELYHKDPSNLLIKSNLKSDHHASPSKPQATCNIKSETCSVCERKLPGDVFYSGDCGHIFCKECWTFHIEMQISQGLSTGIECMAMRCFVLISEDLVLNLLTKPSFRKKYQQFAFSDYVKSHPELRFCPGRNCKSIIRTKGFKSRRIICKYCKTSFCFKCGSDYHAPTSCEVIKKWVTKCADDSETANYIGAHTKDCPKCSICIEKNGGCNHMQAILFYVDWNAHGSDYYECSRYKVDKHMEVESSNAKAREALKKYLFYFERWENHSKSLNLEKETLENIKARIDVKVMSQQGTWIDHQYLLDAATLLLKFEYQQAQLEAEIEDLSWKVEHSEATTRGEYENQMDIAEKRRVILLKDFLCL
ncbi:putative E3 ubiquitin-protein ligase ariadne-2 [Nymphon striatum]|nr:putative E3 ubiquitin-protein ligase ariadne-2 [Nymphon striatum]